MTNVLVLYDRWNPSVQLSLRFLRTMADGVVSLACVKVTEVTSKYLNEADIVISIRGNDKLTFRIASTARKNGKIFVVMADDNLAELPREAVVDPSRKKQFKRILHIADYVIADTEILAKRLCQIGETDKYVLFNALVEDDSCVSPPPVSANQKIVYAAGRNHEELFDSYVKPALERVVKRDRKHSFSLHCVGVDPNLEDFSGVLDVYVHPHMDMDAYHKFMEESKYTIGVAPLHDDDFCKYKYFNKYIEYARMGIVGVYSNCLPFNLIVTNGVNGLLCGNSAEEWATAINTLLEDDQLRVDIARNAQKVLCERFNPIQVRRVFLESFPLFTSYKASEKSEISQFKIEFYIALHAAWRVKERIVLAALLLRRRGFVGLYKKLLSMLTGRQNERR